MARDGGREELKRIGPTRASSRVMGRRQTLLAFGVRKSNRQLICPRRALVRHTQPASNPLQL
jgi:hypothetical protein